MSWGKLVSQGCTLLFSPLPEGCAIPTPLTQIYLHLLRPPRPSASQRFSAPCHNQERSRRKHALHQGLWEKAQRDSSISTAKCSLPILSQCPPNHQGSLMPPLSPLCTLCRPLALPCQGCICFHGASLSFLPENLSFKIPLPQAASTANCHPHLKRLSSLVHRHRVFQLPAPRLPSSG